MWSSLNSIFSIFFADASIPIAPSSLYHWIADNACGFRTDESCIFNIVLQYCIDVLFVPGFDPVRRECVCLNSIHASSNRYNPRPPPLLELKQPPLVALSQCRFWPIADIPSCTAHVRFRG